MKPLRSASVPCRTPCTVSRRTVPRFCTGSKITVAGRPNVSSVPWSVSVTPSGTVTVDDADGVAGAVLVAFEGEEEVVVVPAEPQPASTSATAAATPASAGRRRIGWGIRTFCIATGACPRRAGSAAEQALAEVGAHLVQADPFLLHGVAFTDRHGVVLEGVEVDGDAVRRADLVLAAIAPADRPGVVEVDVPPDAAQLGGEVACLR